MTVLEAYQQYKSIRKVAKLLHMSRRTVAKYLKDPRPRRYGPRPPRPSKLAPFYGYLQQPMARGVFNASRLYQELRAMGYTGGKTILKDYRKPFRPPRAPKAVVRYEVGPGEQAQVDLAEVRYVDEQGQLHRLYVFVMVLSYSRMMFVEFVRRADMPAFLRGHVHAFEFFGGVPRRILYDRTKLAVFGVDANGQPVWQQRFADFALAMGFQPQACAAYRAQTKGRVERAIRYLKEHFWPGVRFTDLVALNDQVRAWLQGVANRRVHGSTHRQPADMLAEERLRAVSPRDVWMAYVGVEAVVSRDGFVSVEGSRYGVPWAYAGQTVEVRILTRTVEVWSNGVRAAVHPRQGGTGQTLLLPGQWEGLPLTTARRFPSFGFQVRTPDVEHRSLAVYEALAEVSRG